MEEKRMAVKANTAALRNTAEKAVSGGNQSKSVNVRKSALPANKSNMHAVRAPRIINIKKTDKKPFPWSAVFVAMILTALFLFMMMNYAEVDKYRSEINDLDNKMAVMQKTQDALEVQLSNKYSLTEIKDYAENELGMVTKDKLNSHRITIEQDDRVEMRSYDDGDEGGAGFLLTGLGEVIRDFFKSGK